MNKGSRIIVVSSFCYFVKRVYQLKQKMGAGLYRNIFILQKIQIPILFILNKW